MKKYDVKITYGGVFELNGIEDCEDMDKAIEFAEEKMFDYGDIKILKREAVVSR